jgi:hypothetical protein
VGACDGTFVLSSGYTMFSLEMEIHRERVRGDSRAVAPCGYCHKTADQIPTLFVFLAEFVRHSFKINKRTTKRL